MDAATKKSLRKEAKSLSALVRIGKNGITKSIIEEINKQLKKNKLIKVRFLKSALEDHDKKEIIPDLIKKTHSIHVGTVGFVVTLAYEKP